MVAHFTIKLGYISRILFLIVYFCKTDKTTTMRILLAFFLLIFFTQCKTSEDISPSCKLREYYINTYTDSPNYFAKLEYNQQRNLVLHKVEIPRPATPTFFIPDQGVKDSITYKNGKLDKIYRFSQVGANTFRLERIDSYSHNSQNQIAKIIQQQLYYGTYVYAVNELVYSYKNSKIDFVASETKRAVYKGPNIPTLNTVPDTSIATNIDTTYYTFDGNNLSSQITKKYEFSDNFSINRQLNLRFISEVFYTDYDDKSNPLYQLPIESKIFEPLSANNYRTKRYRTRIAVKETESQSFNTDMHKFEYNSRGFPTYINSNVTATTVLVEKSIPYFVYDCN